MCHICRERFSLFSAQKTPIYTLKPNINVPSFFKPSPSLGSLGNWYRCQFNLLHTLVEYFWTGNLESMGTA